MIAFVMTWLTIQTIIHEAFRKKVWRIGLKAVIAFCIRIGRPQWISGERAEVFFENLQSKPESYNEKQGYIAFAGDPGAFRLGIYVPLPQILVHSDKLPGQH